MKIKKQIIMMSKLLFYGIFFQTLFSSILLANEGKAQKESIYDIQVSLSIKNTPLKDVIQVLEKRTNFNFTYNTVNINKNKPLNIVANEESLAEILTSISKQTSLKFTRINRNIHISKRAFGTAKITEILDEKVELLQQRITGSVISEEDNQPLPGVSILIKGTTNGTITDIDGKFKLEVPAESVLQFSFVGFLTQEIEVGNQTSLEVVLRQDLEQLDEVVVVGYGTQKKSDLTGSVVSVKAEEIENQGPKTNVLETILGLTPGLNLTLNSNTAEQESVGIQIRGRNSITASNTPLIVLDGVPYVGGLNELNQNDIESIEVLKDASSTAIYGARGANGVILITTKRGKEGKPKISYDGSYGIKEIYNLPPLMNGQEHWDFAVERYREDVIASYPTRLKNYEEGNSTDWVDLATRKGKQIRHNLKLEGGSEKVKYFLSGTYSDVEGVAAGDNFTQYSFRSNLKFNLTDWLTIGTNSQYTSQDLSGLNANFNQAFFLIPLINPYEEDGSVALYPWPEEPLFQNPLSNLNVIDEDYRRNLFSNNYLKIDFPFISGLSYQLNTGLTFIDAQTGRFWGDNTVVGFENNGQSFTNNATQKDLLVENLLVYQKSWNKHNLNVTALYSTQSYKSEGRSVTARGFPTNVLTWYQPEVAEVVEPKSTYLEQNYISQMGRVNYNYNSKYLLTLTLRRDGYSGFGAENKFGVFPSLAAGWNIGDEEFLSAVDWLDQWKIRSSYGKNGNQAISPYQTLASLNQQNYLTGPTGTETAPGYYPGSLASPGLGWETSISFNLGMDFMFFNGRLQSSIDFYNTNTEDLLLNRSISSTHGISSITQNIGETNNKGFEFSISSVNIDHKGLKWTTSLNFSHNKNTITKLYGNGEDDVINSWFIGKPIDVNYGYVYDGVWQKEEDIENSVQPNASPGDVKVKNTNNDDEIGPDDRSFMGQSSPKFTAGLNNSISYKKFRFSFILFTQQGATRVNPLWDTDMVWSDVRRNSIKLNNWNENNPTNEYPANRDGTNPYGLRFYQDASFLRLRDVTLAYSFGNVLFKENVGLSQLNLYFNIRNALTFTNWEGLDPEISNQRGIPMDRMFLFGLNFGF